MNKVKLNSKESRDLFFNHNFSSMIFLDEILNYNNVKIEKGKENCFYYLLDSDLHKSLNVYFDKQNAQINGKYKKARLYMLETENLYIAAVCETGDRGSGWYFCNKMNLMPSRGYSNGKDFFALPEELKKELSDAMQEILNNLIRNKEYQESLVSKSNLFK